MAAYLILGSTRVTRQPACRDTFAAWILAEDKETTYAAIRQNAQHKTLLASVALLDSRNCQVRVALPSSDRARLYQFWTFLADLSASAHCLGSRCWCDRCALSGHPVYAVAPEADDGGEEVLISPEVVETCFSPSILLPSSRSQAELVFAGCHRQFLVLTLLACSVFGNPDSFTCLTHWPRLLAVPPPMIDWFPSCTHIVGTCIMIFLDVHPVPTHRLLQLCSLLYNLRQGS
jgi:hypothetical protein